MTKKLTELDVEQIRIEYLSGINSPELAKKHGVSPDTIIYHLRKENLTRVGHPQLLNGAQVAREYLSGINSPELAQKYGVSSVAIRYQLKKEGVSIRKVPLIENENEVISLYNDGKSTIEIGMLFKSSHNRISCILKSHGIKLRTRKEALQKYVRYNICVICGIKFRPRESYISTKGAIRKTCSDACKHVLQSKISTHDVGHSQAYYQKRRREFYLDICTWCESTTARLDTHHIDRDKSNNTKENLMCLCVHCHAYLHYVEDGTRGRFER